MKALKFCPMLALSCILPSFVKALSGTRVRNFSGILASENIGRIDYPRLTIAALALASQVT